MRNDEMDIETKAVDLEQELTRPGPIAGAARWQRAPGKWFKVAPGGVIEVGEDELRAFEKENHALVRGKNAQERLDMLEAAAIDTPDAPVDDAGQVV